MRSRDVLLLGLFIFPLVLLMSCNLSVYKQDKNELTLKIIPDKEVYQEDEDISITLELMNNTNRPIKIFSYSYSPAFYLSAGWYFKSANHSIGVGNLLGYPASIEVEGRKITPQLTWEIIPPSGTYKTSTPLHTKTPDSDDPETIIPPDTYDIYSIYEFNEDKTKAMGITIDKSDESLVWFGKVVSNTIKITIKPKK